MFLKFHFFLESKYYSLNISNNLKLFNIHLTAFNNYNFDFFLLHKVYFIKKTREKFNIYCWIKNKYVYNIMSDLAELNLRVFNNHNFILELIIILFTFTAP